MSITQTGELARISGKCSRLGHLYDLASDAAVTILLFIAIGIGVGAKPGIALPFPSSILGTAAGCAIALIFFLHMRIEEMAGKVATRQASLGGFETEDVLYLLPLVTLCDGVAPFLLTASLCAPLFAIWVVIDYLRALRRQRSMLARAHTRGSPISTTAAANTAAGPMRCIETPALAATQADANQTMLVRMRSFDVQALRCEFAHQGAFVFVPDFLPPETTAQLIAAVESVRASVHRNYLPGHKQGGSVSRYAIDVLAPCIAHLYRSAAFID